MSDNYTVSVNLDVLGYEQSLIEFLKNQQQFTGYDFKGTNLATLNRLLSYNTYNIAHYGSMISNEMSIDTAVLRQSQISHATSLNYLPHSRVSAQRRLKMINREKFWAGHRQKFGKLNDKAGLEFILSKLDETNKFSLATEYAYILATIKRETNATYQTVLS